MFPRPPGIGTSRPDNKAEDLGASCWEIKFAGKATGVPGNQEAIKPTLIQQGLLIIYQKFLWF